LDAEGKKFHFHASDVDVLMNIIHGHSAVMKRLSALGQPTMTLLETYNSYDHRVMAEHLDIGMGSVVEWTALRIVVSHRGDIGEDVIFLSYEQRI
jgi:hypothetical protein